MKTVRGSRFFLFCILFTVCSIESTYVFGQDWPLPGTRLIRRQMRHYRPSYAPQRQQTLVENQPFYSELLTIFGICISIGAQHPPVPQMHESASTAALDSRVELTETQKTCEICLGAVELADCFRCCSNRHNIHLPCFADWILSSNPANIKTCPLCRDPLISDPRQLHTLVIQTNPEYEPDKWEILASHVQVLKRAKPVEMSAQDWLAAFSLILAKGTPAHLRAFLAFDLVDVNHQLVNGQGAVAILIRGIGFLQNEQRRVDRLRGNLQLLLEHPRIQLNRCDGDLHLIYHAINANLFPVFLQILDASPQLNLAAVFRYVCGLPGRDHIFNYLLTCKLFDIFEPDDYDCSALHIAVSKGQTEYANILLDSPQLTLNHFLARDQRTGRTVLHTAMISAHDELIEKMTTAFSGINWDIKDYSGASVAQLYENRA